MSSFFSKGKGSSSGSNKVNEAAAKLPVTHDIFTEPDASAKPKKKWQYNAEQLKMVSDTWS
jgi:hypothetical protein